MIALSAGMALVMFGPVAYAASLQQLQQEEAQAQSQLAAEEQQYTQTQNSINDTESEMSKLNQDLSSAKAQIGSTSQQIQVTNANIRTTQNLLNSTQAQLTETEQQLSTTTADYQKTTALIVVTKKHLSQQSQMLSGQLQLIEERGSVGYLDVILGARSFSDFISRAELLGQIASSAANEVQVIKNEESAMLLEQANLQKETQFLSQAKNSISQHEAMLQNEQVLLNREKEHSLVLQADATQEASQVSVGLAQRQQLIGQLQSQKNQLSSGMANLQSQIASIVGQIQSLLQQFNSGGLSRQALYNAMLPVVTPIASQWGVPPALIIAVITQESGGDSSAVSSAGAVGLMQLEPGTASDIASAVGLSPATVSQELYNPEDNIELGTFYLHSMLSMFGGNTSLALAAYNAGPGAVQQYGGIPPYPQTQQYVQDVTSLYNLYLSY